MKEMQIFELGFSAIRNCPKRKINPKELKYVFNSKTEPPIDKFVKSTSKKKVNKNAIFNFRQYLLGKEVDIKMTQDEIKTLFANKKFDEFGTQAFEFLTKKLNIPERLKPQYICADINSNAKMAYSYPQNIIFVNPNAVFADKEELLISLLHEFQHCKQNICMLRHPEIGDKAVDFYAKILSKSQAKNIDNQIRNYSIEELRGFGWSEDALKEFSMGKDLLSRNQTEEYEKYLQELMKELEKQYLKSIGNFRASVVEELGLLKEGSREARRAKKYFETTASENSYWQKDNGIDYGKYLFDIRENEAIVAQDMIALRIRENQQGCYLKALNEVTKRISKSTVKDKTVSDVEKHIAEQNAKGIGFREIISYLFD